MNLMVKKNERLGVMKVGSGCALRVWKYLDHELPSTFQHSNSDV